MSQVARLYRFRGRHYVPSLPFPWCEPHEHDYTVEVVVDGDPPVVVDTDLLDAAWEETCSRSSGSLTGRAVDLTEGRGAENTTVEALSAEWLAAMNLAVPGVSRVTVWEDDSRWGSAEW